MSSLGIVSQTLAPVRPGTVIKLTEQELNQDPKDMASSKIRGMFLDKPHRPSMSTTTGPRGSLKENILAMSLFPNIINANYRLSQTGTMRTAGQGP
jgi:hypothetical protein